MTENYDISANDKQIAYNLIAKQTNIPAYAVEKDWWVVQTLTILFELGSRQTPCI